MRKKIDFLSINRTVIAVLKDRNYKKYAIKRPISLKIINAIDNWARNKTLSLITKKKMNKGLIYILIIFLSFSTAKTEVLERINIQGNKRVSNETIKIYGNIEIGKDYSEKTINEIVRNLYSTDFFEEVNVNLKNNTLTVTLKEYPIIDNLILLGENSKKFKEAISKNIFSKEKRSFIKNNLAKDIEIIKNIYSSLGYNFIKIDVKTKKLSEDKVDVLIEIDKGKQTKISKNKFYRK